MMVWGKSRGGEVFVTVRDQSSLLHDLDQRLKEKQGFSVATLNLDHVVKLRSDVDFRNAYQSHSHITADGNPIVWLSRLAGQKVSLVPGSELIEPLVALAAHRGAKVALFGATMEALEASASQLCAQYTDLEIALCRAPAMGFDPLGPSAADDIAAIGNSGAGLCLLALGAPKQEVFAARAQKELPEVGFVSIGAGLDFIAGSQRRAPRWMRSIAIEWIWRLVNDPRRLAARYGACLLAVPGLTFRALRLRFLRGKDRSQTS